MESNTVSKVARPLAEWQRDKLQNLSSVGTQCWLSIWKEMENRADENDTSLFCDGIWDSVHCWPSAKAGDTSTHSCQDILKENGEYDPSQLSTIRGNAVRICTENGTWLWGDWTNYNECLHSLEENTMIGINNGTSDSDSVRDAVKYILFIGSVLSLICLSTSLILFYYFKNLRCNRITIHIHLMMSLLLRYIFLIIIAEPFVFERDVNYRSKDWSCKIVLSCLMYTTVGSISWMFLQGHYLHSRLTTNIFDRNTSFKIYYFIGWGFPFFLIVAWASIMEVIHPIHCWKKYYEIKLLWMLVGPMLLALLINLVFLINIIRILLTRVQRSGAASETIQFKRAVKAAAVLLPLLGINNLIFVYNPGAQYEAIYMISNSTIQSTQGIFVSLLYCFMSNDVQDAIRGEYRKFSVRRNANTIIKRARSSRRTCNSGTSCNIPTTSLMMMTPEPQRLLKSTDQRSSYNACNKENPFPTILHYQKSPKSNRKVINQIENIELPEGILLQTLHSPSPNGPPLDLV